MALLTGANDSAGTANTRGGVSVEQALKVPCRDDGALAVRRGAQGVDGGWKIESRGADGRLRQKADCLRRAGDLLHNQKRAENRREHQ